LQAFTTSPNPQCQLPRFAMCRWIATPGTPTPDGPCRPAALSRAAWVSAGSAAMAFSLEWSYTS